MVCPKEVTLYVWSMVCPIEKATPYGWFMVCPIEKLTLYEWFMVCPIEKLTLYGWSMVCQSGAVCEVCEAIYSNPTASPQRWRC